MASSAMSLSFLSVSPQTSFPLPEPNAVGFSSVSFPASSSSHKPFLLLSSSSSTIGLFGTSRSSYMSRFVKNVSISSEFDQTEDLDEDVPRPRFSEDLKLFVGNLPFSADSAVLAGLFEQAGNVEMVEVIYDKITGRSRGFGFVTMSTVEEVKTAAQQLNGYELEGRALRVNYGQGGPSRVSYGSAPPPRRDNSSFRGSRGGGSSFDGSNRVYVGNLAWGVDNLALETLFSELGKVMDAKVVYDRDTGRSRGFGFVTYTSSDEVNSAVESLNGVDLNGRAIRVSPAESRTKSEF